MPTPRKHPDEGVIARLLGRYTLRTDPHNVILEDSERDRDARRTYYPTVRRALMAILERETTATLARSAAEEVRDVAEAMREAEERIDRAWAARDAATPERPKSDGYDS